MGTPGERGIATVPAHPSPAPEVSVRFHDSLRGLPAGVAVVAFRRADGVTVAAVSTGLTVVSASPPVLGIRFAPGAGEVDRVADADLVGVSLLAAHQEVACQAVLAGEDDLVQALPWTAPPAGGVVLDGATSWLSCRTQRTENGPDGLRLVAEVLDAAETDRGRPPLVYVRGGLGALDTASLAMPATPALAHVTRLAQAARSEVENLASAHGIEGSVVAAVDEDAVFLVVANRSGVPGIAVGHRVPLIPPVGSVFITTSGSVAMEHWLGRLDSLGEDVIGRMVEKLERVSARGYSLSLAPPEGLDTYTIVRNYSSPFRTAEHERQFRELIRRTADSYEPDVRPAGRYRLRSIVVPVVGSLGQVEVALRVANFGDELTGAQVQDWIERLADSAARVAGRFALDVAGSPAGEPA